MEKQLENVQPSQRPVFILKYGPPASGKSSCNPKFLEAAASLGDVDAKTLVDANVDEVVDDLDVNGLTRQRPFNEVVYAQLRILADKIVDSVVDTAIKTKKNLALEITGKSLDMSWFRKQLVEPMRKNGYKILIVYPLVPLQTLLQRNEERGEKLGRQPADDVIRQSVQAAAFHLGQLLPVVDAVMVYDNRSTTEKCAHEIIHCRSGQCTAYDFTTQKNVDIKCEEGQCRSGLPQAIEESINKLFGTSISVTPPFLFEGESISPSDIAKMARCLRVGDHTFILRWTSVSPPLDGIRRYEFWGLQPIFTDGPLVPTFFVELDNSIVGHHARKQALDKARSLILAFTEDRVRIWSAPIAPAAPPPPLGHGS